MVKWILWINKWDMQQSSFNLLCSIVWMSVFHTVPQETMIWLGAGLSNFKFVWPPLTELIWPIQMHFSNPIRKWLVFCAQQGVSCRGRRTSCSFTFQTLSITARDLMFSLCAQQSYSSPANSPQAILSAYAVRPAWLPQSTSILSAFASLCFHTVPVPYSTQRLNIQPQLKGRELKGSSWRHLYHVHMRDLWRFIVDVFFGLSYSAILMYITLKTVDL